MVGHIGVAMFIFEGNAVIMNVRSEAKNKEKYPFILILSIITTLLVFVSFALVCYLTFRNETKDIVTLNLPINGFGIFVVACVSVNALCSYPI
jgi:amino acid permease